MIPFSLLLSRISGKCMPFLFHLCLAWQMQKRTGFESGSKTVLLLSYL